MDSQIQDLLDRQRHILTTEQAEGRGIARDRLIRAVADGQLQRVARGAYVDRVAYTKAAPGSRHALSGRAIQAMLSASFPLSHYSAACGWRLPVLPPIPGLVQLTRLDGGARRRNASYVTHRPVGRVQVEEHDGLILVPPAVAWAGMRHLGLEALVAAGDAALRLGLMNLQEADSAIVSSLDRGPAGVLGAALSMLDGRSESAGESRCRVVLIRLGYDIDVQVEVRGGRSHRTERADFRIRGERVAIQFEAPARSSDPVRHGVTAKTTSRAEFLRSLGFEVVLLTWDDLAKPERIRQLLDAAIRRSHGRASHGL